MAEVMLSLLEVDLTEGTTLSLHLNYKTINEVSTMCGQKHPIQGSHNSHARPALLHLQYILHLSYCCCHYFQSADRGTITLSVCHQPTANHLHVIVMKASGLPLPKSDAPEGCGKWFSI